MGKKFKKIPELRIRGRVYQLTEVGSEDEGRWTYFLLLGEGESERTMHAKYTFDSRKDALEGMREQAKMGMEAIYGHVPGAKLVVNKW